MSDFFSRILKCSFTIITHKPPLFGLKWRDQNRMYVWINIQIVGQISDPPLKKIKASENNATTFPFPIWNHTPFALRSLAQHCPFLRSPALSSTSVWQVAGWKVLCPWLFPKDFHVWVAINLHDCWMNPLWTNLLWERSWSHGVWMLFARETAKISNKKNGSPARKLCQVSPGAKQPMWVECLGGGGWSSYPIAI